MFGEITIESIGFRFKKRQRKFVKVLGKRGRAPHYSERPTKCSVVGALGINASQCAPISFIVWPMAHLYTLNSRVTRSLSFSHSFLNELPWNVPLFPIWFIHSNVCPRNIKQSIELDHEPWIHYLIHGMLRVMSKEIHRVFQRSFMNVLTLF